MCEEKPRALIVDDEQVVCDLLHDELNDRGYLCTTVCSGNDAVVKLATGDFEVVLLDIRLPGMSGMEVLREISLNYGNITAIMITAVNDVDTAIEAMKLGASDYVVKPFDIDRLVNSIHIALEMRQAINRFPTEMDAIARGVEARIDPYFSCSKVVTQQTIDIAQQVGIAEEEIQRWAAAKAMLDSEKNRAIESLLDKLRQSPLAQNMLGMAELYLHTLESRESWN